MAGVAPLEEEKDALVIVTQVKSDIHFDDLMRADMRPSGVPETPPNDLATEEKKKKETRNDDCCDCTCDCCCCSWCWDCLGSCCDGCGDCLDGCCDCDD